MPHPPQDCGLFARFQDDFERLAAGRKIKRSLELGKGHDMGDKFGGVEPSIRNQIENGPHSMAVESDVPCRKSSR